MSRPIEPELEFPDRGRIAAVDYGTVRVGLAICDPDRILASPLCVLKRGNPTDEANSLRLIANEENLLGWVVGLPIHLDGAESKKSAEARRFAKWLASETHLPVRMFDERFSTAMADDRLESASLTNKRRKQRIDAVAAQVLLESFLESARGRGTIPGLNPNDKAKGGDAIDS